MASSGDWKLSGTVIARELLRNMELGRFEMAYAVLLPCYFTVFLNPGDFTKLKGVLGLVAEDARKAFRAKAAELNAGPKQAGLRKRASRKEHRIACGMAMCIFIPS